MHASLIGPEAPQRYDLSSLLETSRLLVGSLDADFILDNLLRIAMAKLLSTRGAILWRDASGLFRIARARGIPGWKPGGALRLPQALIRGELEPENWPEPLRKAGLVALFPLVAQNGPLGALLLGAKATGETYSAYERQYLEALTNITALGLSSAFVVKQLRQTNRELDRRVHELQTLLDLSRTLNSTLDREALLKRIGYTLMGQLLVSRFAILFRPPGRPAAMLLARGLPAPLSAEAIPAAWLEEPRARRIASEEAPPDWGLEWIVPIRLQDGPRGVLLVGPRAAGTPLEEAELRFLEAAAQLAGIALENTYLIETWLEKQRLDEELRLAQRIQQGLLPRKLPDIPGFELAAYAHSIRPVGGDYYDVLPLERERFLVAIADVTGKGVPAALLMANLQAMLHVLASIPMSIEEATARINAIICHNTDPGTFITFFWGILDPGRRTFRYVNAGHVPPLWLRANGDLEELSTGGLLLGVLPTAGPYRSCAIEMEPGDVLFLYTDGLTETCDPQGTWYDVDRLRMALRKWRDTPAPLLLEALLGELRAFSGRETFDDDLTALVLRAHL
ncbi:MAG: SpoIIE family protein phosphatase [Bacteroidetes bacterium]|nr:SpoIIE family protein phosphatase [Rhodothermia bacterium]MCS7154641.1 SpoIIE family protein phosphatase [Bacteroidota bacterium]MCX7906358.1 SpoIIE family protein phosphatase [Bacteroidota bacterium]MDW8137434.1 SpoIIE family protein phosphatase [Bacteroidota bacterium]MDW8285612.1 SpoIIE family protein phosphatase [Bacteroidota bacterium]